jgi:hypothetical protein
MERFSTTIQKMKIITICYVQCMTCPYVWFPKPLRTFKITLVLGCTPKIVWLISTGGGANREALGEID